jgi:dTDP-4-dehydrorhamnose reductase
MANAGPILIAGKTGRLAQALIEEAGRLGAAVRAIGRPRLDIEDRDSIARIMAAEAPRAIVNAAGHVAVDDAERNPARAYAVNREGAAFLAAAAGRAGIPFVHVSSDYVFDGKKGQPYVEDDVPAPLSVYGRSKAAGEEAVLAACPAANIVRTSWVYGPHGSNFLTTMLRLAETEDVVRVVADQYGTPTADTDLARALLAIVLRRLEQPAAVNSGIYHVSGSGETTWLGFAEEIFSGWGRRGNRVPKIQPISLSEWHGPAQRPRYSRLDCGKAERTFGIRLPDWRDSLELCLDSLAQTRARKAGV